MKLQVPARTPLLAAMTAIVVFSGCTATLPQSRTEPASSSTVRAALSQPPGVESTQTTQRSRVLFDSEMDSFDASDTLSYALSLKGTRYRYGGTSPREGFDCSGFVRHVFGHFGVDLPRSAREMAAALPKIDINERRPGDLLFFNTNGRPYSHVGIYIGDGRFVHATSTAGRTVKVSNLEETYWRKRLVGVRRPPAHALALAFVAERLSQSL